MLVKFNMFLLVKYCMRVCVSSCYFYYSWWLSSWFGLLFLNSDWTQSVTKAAAATVIYSASENNLRNVVLISLFITINFPFHELKKWLGKKSEIPKGHVCELWWNEHTKSRKEIRSFSYQTKPIFLILLGTINWYCTCVILGSHIFFVNLVLWEISLKLELKR